MKGLSVTLAPASLNMAAGARGDAQRAGWDHRVHEALRRLSEWLRLDPGREGRERSHCLLEVRGQRASPLFLAQAARAPGVSSVPGTVKSPGAPNDFSSLL